MTAGMPSLVHTCLRVVDPNASVRFYETLGLPGDGDFETPQDPPR